MKVLGFLASLLACLILCSRVTADPAIVDLNAYRGRVVVLDFWASWCGPCRKSFPWLNQMQEKYRDQGLEVIGVNVDASREDAEEFLAKYPAQFKVVFDPDGELAATYELLGMPSSIIIDRQGQIAGRHTGFREKKRTEYENDLIKYLGRWDEQPAGTRLELSK